MNITESDASINIEICSEHCSLKCVKCGRQKPDFVGKPDLAPDDFKKICKVFKKVHFNGIYGDSIFHKQFFEMLQITKDYKCDLRVHTAGGIKSRTWWKRAFELSKELGNVTWIFGLDGLPEESEMYRVNQDGEFVWEMMKMGANMGVPIEWQYIVFSYNEEHIDEAKEMAKAHNITFFNILSSRWDGPTDPFMPKNKNLRLSSRKLNGTGFYPKCLETTPSFIKDGYFVPCEYDKPIPELCIPKLHISKVKDIITDIFESQEWKEFYKKLYNNTPPNDICKRICSHKWDIRKKIYDKNATNR